MSSPTSTVPLVVPEKLAQSSNMLHKLNAANIQSLIDLYQDQQALHQRWEDANNNADTILENSDHELAVLFRDKTVKLEELNSEADDELEDKIKALKADYKAAKEARADELETKYRVPALQAITSDSAGETVTEAQAAEAISTSKDIIGQLRTIRANLVTQGALASPDEWVLPSTMAKSTRREDKTFTPKFDMAEINGEDQGQATKATELAKKTGKVSRDAFINSFVNSLAQPDSDVTGREMWEAQKPGYVHSFHVGPIAGITYNVKVRKASRTYTKTSTTISSITTSPDTTPVQDSPQEAPVQDVEF